MKQNRQAILYACIAVLSWSTVATAFKKSLEHITHFELVLVACVTSLLIFTILMTIQKKWHLIKGLSLKEWGYFALLGLLNPVAYYLVLFKSYDLLPAQVAQPINYAWPIVLVVLLAIFTRQPIPGKKYIGMAISLGGVAMISLGGGQALGSRLPVGGLLLAALSAFLWASYWVVNNKNKERFDASLAFFMTFLFGSIYMTAASLFVGVDLNTAPLRIVCNSGRGRLDPKCTPPGVGILLETAAALIVTVTVQEFTLFEFTDVPLDVVFFKDRLLHRLIHKIVSGLKLAAHRKSIFLDDREHRIALSVEMHRLVSPCGVAFAHHRKTVIPFGRIQFSSVELIAPDEFEPASLRQHRRRPFPRDRRQSPADRNQQPCNPAAHSAIRSLLNVKKNEIAMTNAAAK